LRLGRTFTTTALLVVAVVLPLFVQFLAQGSQHTAQQRIFVVVAGSLAVAWVIDGVLRRTRGHRQRPASGNARPPARPVRRAYVVPFDLPSPPGLLVGRDAELRLVRQHLTQSAVDETVPRAVVIMGDAGVGKSGLAITAAHALMDEYADGQIFIGLDSRQNTAYVIQRLLVALRDPNDEQPENVADLAFYRHRTKGRRLLVVLDNVTSKVNLTEVLPNSRRSSLIVTTRDPVIAINGNRLDITLEPLGIQASHELVTALLGTARVNAEPDAVRTLVEDVRGFPAAIRIAGALLSTRRNWSLHNALDRRVEVTGIRRGAGDEGPFDGILDLAFALLTEPERLCLCLLGLSPQRTVSPWMLAAMSSSLAHAQMPSSEAAAERVLENFAQVRLADRRLDTPAGVMTYRIPSYVHRYAAFQAHSRLKKSDVTRAGQALMEERRSRASREADEIVRTQVYRLLEAGELTAALETARQTVAFSQESAPGGSNAGRVSDSAGGLALAQTALAEVYSELGYFDEAQALASTGRAGGAQRPGAVVRALRVLGGVARKRRHLADAVVLLREADQVCQELDDPTEFIRVQRELAVALALAGDYVEAMRVVRHAENLCDQIGEQGLRRKPGVLWAFAVVLRVQGLYAAADDKLDVADNLLSVSDAGADHPARSERLWRPWVRFERATVALNDERAEQCRESAVMALDDFAAMNHRYGAAQARHLYGIACLRDNRLRRAVPALEESLDDLRACGDRQKEAHVALALASAYYATQRFRDAESLFRAAESSFDVLGDEQGSAAATRQRKLLETNSGDRRHRADEPLVTAAWEYKFVA
jgi:tetratricopeptide (TPR) repeat protein